MNFTKLIGLFLVIAVFSTSLKAKETCSTISEIAKQINEIVREESVYNPETGFIEDRRSRGFKSFTLKCRDELKQLLRSDKKSDFNKIQLLNAMYTLLSFYRDDSLTSAYEYAIRNFSGSASHKSIIKKNLTNIYLQSASVSKLNSDYLQSKLEVENESISSAKLSVYTVIDGRHLRKKPLVLQNETQKAIIFIGHPLCHFSQNFVSWLEGREDDFFKNVLFISIARARSLRDLELAYGYNLNHKRPFNLVLNADNWSPITTWETPSFYFFYGGEVVDQVVGWNKNKKGEFIEALDKLKDL